MNEQQFLADLMLQSTPDPSFVMTGGDGISTPPLNPSSPQAPTGDPRSDVLAMMLLNEQKRQLAEQKGFSGGHTGRGGGAANFMDKIMGARARESGATRLEDMFADYGAARSREEAAAERKAAEAAAVARKQGLEDFFLKEGYKAQIKGPEGKFAKINAGQFTPESLAAYDKSGNIGDLVQRDAWKDAGTHFVNTITGEKIEKNIAQVKEQTYYPVVIVI